MPGRQFDRPRVSIDVDGRRLGPDYMGLVESIELHQVWDGADQLTLQMRAWDDVRNDQVVIGERVLAPGTSIVLHAGYGAEMHTVGRYDVVRHQPTYGPSRPPSVMIEAHDGFARLMHDQWPGDYGQPPTYTDVAKILARKYGMGLAADTSSPIQYMTRLRRRRRRRHGKTTTTTSEVQQRIVKNAGDTDAKMIKLLAGMAGFLVPKVRYIAPTSPEAAWLAETHQVTERLSGRDVLLFHRLDVQRQLSAPGVIRFDRREHAGIPSTLLSFAPDQNTSDVPTAVRVTGVVAGPPKEIMTVEAEVVGPALLQERSALLLRASRASDPSEAARLREKALQIGDQVAVTRVERTTAPHTQAQRQAAANAGATILEVLSDTAKATMAYDVRSGRRVQTMRREAVRGTVLAGSAGDLERLARAWLQSRLQLLTTASAASRDTPGLERVRPNQVHEFVGMGPTYDGVYLVLEATHVWTGEGHRVNMRLQRVAEDPTTVRSSAASEGS